MAKRLLLERFWGKVEITDSCWWWHGAVTSDYGVFWLGPRNVLVHRFAYELLVGPIPEGLTIDHLCLNTTCVNPEHMEVVTKGENTRRGKRRITHCPKGHAYDETNTYLHPDTGARQCKQCRSAWNRAWRARQLAAA